MAKKHDMRKTLYIVVIMLLLFRVWLASCMNLHVIIRGGGFDDWLQICDGIEILKGNWLGKYSSAILVKNLSFPVFIAICSFLQMPYTVGYAVFIILAAFIFVHALEPLIKSVYVRALVFVAVVYLPVGFLSASALRIYRNALIPWTVLALMSCVFAIYLRRDKKAVRLLPWALLGAVYAGFFWNLREDSIWIMPFMVGASLFCVIYWFIKKASMAEFIKKFLVIMIPFMGIVLSVCAFKMMNYRHYGIALTNDRNQGQVARVNNLLYKIDNENENPDLWVSPEAIRKAKEVSPSLAELSDLEEMFVVWSIDGEWAAGDMCTWALRVSAANNGHFKNPIETQEYFKRIGDELEAAFADGRLVKKDAILIGGIGALTTDDFAESFGLTLSTIKEFALQRGCDTNTDIYYTDGKESEISFAEKFLITSLPRTDEQLSNIDANRFAKAMNENVVDRMSRYVGIGVPIVRVYKFLSLIFIIASIGCYFVMLFRMLCKREMLYFPAWLCATAALLTAFLNVYIMVLFSRWMTRDPASPTYSFYAPAAYVLIAVFEVVSIVGAFGSGKETSL